MCSSAEMRFAANNILLMRNYNHDFCAKKSLADRVTEVSESDLNMKTNLVIEWKKQLLNSVFAKYRNFSMSDNVLTDKSFAIICSPQTNQHDILSNFIH